MTVKVQTNLMLPSNLGMVSAAHCGTLQVRQEFVKVLFHTDHRGFVLGAVAGVMKVAATMWMSVVRQAQERGIQRSCFKYSSPKHWYSHVPCTGNVIRVCNIVLNVTFPYVQAAICKPSSKRTGRALEGRRCELAEEVNLSKVVAC